MTISYRSAVSIVQLALYAPSLLIALHLTVRHGLNNLTGFFDLILFSILRILGASFELATISNPTSSSLYTGFTITSSIGLAPLLACTSGLLNLVNNSIKRRRSSSTAGGGVPDLTFSALQLAIIAGLVLGIVGGIKSGHNLSHSSTSITPGAPPIGAFKVQPLSKAGTGILLACYAADVLITLILLPALARSATATPSAKRLLLAIAASLPILSARVVYSILTSYTTDPKFNLVRGNTTAWLCLAVLMEFLIVGIYEGVGITLRQEELKVAGKTDDAPEKSVALGRRTRREND